MKQYCVYVLRCRDGSYYTGITCDVERRLVEHEEGVDPEAYTYKRRPVELVYMEEFQWVYDAIDREKQIKKWSRAKKKALLQEDEKMLLFLAECQNETHSCYYTVWPIAETRRSIFFVMAKNSPLW